MPSPLFAEWVAYFELEPWGQSREDLRAGLVAAVVANCAFGRKRGSKVVKPTDFFANLKDEKRAKPMSAAAMEQQAKAVTRMLGGPFLKRGEKPKGKPAPPPRAARPVRKPRGK